jgi:hypothetical protein
VRKLELDEILGPKDYAAARDELRRRVIELKKLRRIAIGPTVSVVFENRETMRVQVEEMCRAEGLTDQAKVQEELDVYNKILPDEGELGATLFVEMTSSTQLERTLPKLVGLHEHVWFIAGGSRCKATFDPEQFETDKLAAVQYLRFPLDDEAQVALKTAGSAVALAIDHPNYRHQATLGEEQRAELARDLDAA